jgi:hypothetical protein
MDYPPKKLKNHFHEKYSCSCQVDGQQVVQQKAGDLEWHSQTCAIKPRTPKNIYKTRGGIISVKEVPNKSIRNEKQREHVGKLEKKGN